MKNLEKLELFVLKCPVIETELRKAISDYDESNPKFDIEREESIAEYVGQFDLEIRVKA